MMQKTLSTAHLLPGMKVIQTDIGWDKLEGWSEPFHILNSDEALKLAEQCQSVLVEIAPIQDNEHSGPLDNDETQEKQAINNEQQTEDYSDSGGLAPSPYRDNPLREKITLEFCLDCYQQTLETVQECFDRADTGLPIIKSEIEDSAKSLMLSSIARPETLAIICNLKEKTNSLAQKSLDVAVLSLLFGRSAGLKNDELHKLTMAALLHDIGMLRIPREILDQEEPLTIGQKIQIQKHVQYGCDMISETPALKPLNGIVTYHHERYDGLGYPQGLRGRKIPLAARILHITTTFEALTRNRHFTTQQSTTHALRKLYGWRNEALDGQLVERFIKTVGVYPSGTLVQLNNGYTGVVIDVHPSHRSRPSLQLLFSDTGAAFNHIETLDLSQESNREYAIKKTVEPSEITAEHLTAIRKRLGIQHARAA